MNLWQQIIVSVLTSAAVAGAVVVAGGFLAQRIIDRWITMSLESYKARLQQSGFEHQTRFTKLHEKRAEVMAEFYKRLLQTERLFESFTVRARSKGNPLTRDDAEVSMQIAEELWGFFQENAIYFESGTCDKVRKVYEMFNAVWANALLSSVEDGPPEQQKVGTWVRAWKSIHEEVPQLRQDIESDFRKLLGSVSAD